MFSRKNDIPEEYSIEDMTDDQSIVMGNLGIDRAIVMGDPRALKNILTPY
jgi:hypothetical protein